MTTNEFLANAFLVLFVVALTAACGGVMFINWAWKKYLRELDREIPPKVPTAIDGKEANYGPLRRVK